MTPFDSCSSTSTPRASSRSAMSAWRSTLSRLKRSLTRTAHPSLWSERGTLFDELVQIFPHGAVGAAAVGHLVGGRLDLRRGVGHRHRVPGRLHHLQVVVI